MLDFLVKIDTNISNVCYNKNMLGNIIGDLAGSIYEYEQINNCHSVYVKNIIEDNAFFSDDTILTIAIADAILSKSSYETKLKEYALKFDNKLPNVKPYFKTMFSPNFAKWAASNEVGESHGNGAMMRVAPVGFLFNTEEEVKENARLATIPSHNNAFAIESAQTIALIIYYARKGLGKKEIKEKLHLNITKPVVSKFNYTCEDTIDICLYSFFNSNSFEEAIKTAISFGGDTDTNACIVGGMAEAMCGIENSIKQKALGFLPKGFKEVLDKAYKNVKNIHF